MKKRVAKTKVVKSTLPKVPKKLCPVCLEEKNDGAYPVLLKCKHFLHPECAKGMIKLECPMCRAPLNREKTLSKGIKDGIRANEEKYKKDLERELFEEYLASQPQLSIVDFEIHLALSFLERQGIPYIYIPTRIERTSFSIQPPPGVVFQTIVASSLKMIFFDGGAD